MHTSWVKGINVTTQISHSQILHFVGVNLYKVDEEGKRRGRLISVMLMVDLRRGWWVWEGRGEQNKRWQGKWWGDYKTCQNGHRWVTIPRGCCRTCQRSRWRWQKSIRRGAVPWWASRGERRCSNLWCCRRGIAE